MDPIPETYRYIIRSPGSRSGNAIVEGTRIGVHDVIGLLQNGVEWLAYHEDQRGEIDVLVAGQMARTSE